MPTKAACHQALSDLSGQIAGRPLTAALADWLNDVHGVESVSYQTLKAACVQGVEEGRLCDRKGAGIRYGRVFKAEDALHRFSVDIVDMQDIAGPHHSHPNGEIDLITPLEGQATFDGHPAGCDTEVFGPVATLLPYRDTAHAIALAHRGQGSLVTSLYGSDKAALAQTALAVAASHGRVHVITPDVAQAHSGHGNVMPMSQHGASGRAGGGAELGGLSALNFYHQRTAVQASPGVLAALGLYA